MEKVTYSMWSSLLFEDNQGAGARFVQDAWVIMLHKKNTPQQWTLWNTGDFPQYKKSNSKLILWN